MDTSKAMVSITLLTLIRNTKESSERATLRERESKSGQMAEDMKVISRTERRMEKEHLSGQMETNILDPGELIDNTESASTWTSKKETKDKENG